MDAAVRARTAARETVEDIEPPRLRAVLLDRLEQGSMAPGVLVYESALGRKPSLASEAVVDRSVGVQLIYEGLRLTRSLAHEEPWTTAEAGEIDADLEILAADILVSRGFHLLARTEVSDAAVETIRAFGRDQTRRREPDADAPHLIATSKPTSSPWRFGPVSPLPVPILPRRYLSLRPTPLATTRRCPQRRTLSPSRFVGD